MTSRTWLLAALLAAAPGASLALTDADPDDDDHHHAPRVAALVPEHGKAATADATPVDPGALEVELGYAPTWNHRGGTAGFDLAEEGHFHGVTGSLTYGLAPDLDVRLAGGVATVHDATPRHADPSSPAYGAGATDLAVGARWRFLRLEEAALDLALTADAVIPTGASATPGRLGLSQDYWSARGALVATKDVGAFTATGEVALGAPISGDAGGVRAVAQANAAAGWQLASWLQPELELNYQATLGPGAHLLAVTAGVVAPFGAGHRVVAALQHGVWGRSTVQTTGAVLAFKTAL